MNTKNTKHSKHSKTSKSEKMIQIKHKLRKLYNKAKEQRPRTILIPFIHPAYFIEKRYIENKQFEKNIRELQNKHKLQHYNVDPLFQLIFLKVKK